MTKNNVKAVAVLTESESFKLTLAGQTPEVAMSAAMASIQFYNQQQALYAQLQQQQMQRKIDKTQEQCRKKLIEVHNGYTTAKRKYQEVQQARQALMEDNKELQEKYNQKAMQDKKLREAFAMLQQENDSLRRANEQLMQRVQGGGGGGGSSGIQLPQGLGGGGAGAGLGLGGRPASRTAPFGGDSEEDLGLRMDRNSRRASMAGMGRPQLKEHSPLQSPNFNPQRPFSGFDTPANQPVLRNVLNTGGLQLPGSGGKGQLGMMGNRRPSFLNPNSPSGMASL
ncbi:hypothetical protein N2152v2_001509 [Parachlorella kessleri]